MTAHSKTGASSMHRWSVCPGSIRQSEGVPVSSSTYAEDGTDAHTLAARCLSHPLGLDNPRDHIGQAITEDHRTFEVTEEMADAVQVYVDHLNDTFERGDVDQVEVRFDLSEVHPGCFGTADHVRWRPSAKLLIVTDYKHGAGIPVSPENNPQLLYYGLGALMAANYPAARVRLVIIQPRCTIDGEAVRSWEIDVLDLLDFKADLKRYAVATEAPDAPLVAGDHCRFCPAAGVCPRLVETAQVAAKMEFSAAAYDPAKLKAALDLREPVKAWLSALDEFAYAEAVAGRCPPGYKLVDKRAIRKWIDETDAAEWLCFHKDVLPAEIREEPKLLSPAKLEAAKIIKKGEMDKAFTMKESSGFALVPDDDKRPAVTILTAAQEFTAITDQTQGEADGSAGLTPVVQTTQIRDSGEDIPDFLKRKKG